MGKCLGVGAFGKVFRALDETTGAMVAIKTVNRVGVSEKDMEGVMVRPYTRLDSSTLSDASL